MAVFSTSLQLLSQRTISLDFSYASDRYLVESDGLLRNALR